MLTPPRVQELTVEQAVQGAVAIGALAYTLYRRSPWIAAALGAIAVGAAGYWILKNMKDPPENVHLLAPVRNGTN